MIFDMVLELKNREPEPSVQLQIKNDTDKPEASDFSQDPNQFQKEIEDKRQNLMKLEQSHTPRFLQSPYNEKQSQTLVQMKP